MSVAGDDSLYRFDLRAPVRYTAFAQGVHWLTVLLIFAILPIAWHMTTLPREDPTRETWFTIHKSIGMTVLALSVIRIVWRALHPPPPLPGTMARIEAGAAVVSHWLLYAVLFLMPISGYLLSAAGGHPVNYFGLFEIPNIVPRNSDLARSAAAVHILGQWAVYALIALHVLATAWHLTARRDDVLARMLPKQDGMT